MARSLGDAVINIKADMTQALTNLNALNQRFRRVGQSVKSFGMQMTALTTLPLTGIGGASTKMAVEFESAMVKIETLVGISRDRVAELREEVIKLSGGTGKAPAELARALFTVESAGLRGKKALDVLEMSAKASASGLGDTQVVARALTSALQAYAKQGLTASRATDILVGIVREGNLEASELAPTLGRILGPAANLGITFDQVGASIATFTRLGVDSAEAVTGLRGVLNTLIKPTTQSKEALKSVHLSMAKLRDMAKKDLAGALVFLVKKFKGNDEGLAKIIPNVRALSTVLGTAGVQGEKYKEVLKNIQNSQNNLNKAFSRTTETAGFKLKQFFADLKVLAIQIGDILLPDLLAFVAKLRSLAKEFQALSPATKKWLINIAKIVAIIGPILTGLGILIIFMTKVVGAVILLSQWFGAPFLLALAGAVAFIILVGKKLWEMKDRILKVVKEAGVLNRLVKLWGLFKDAVVQAVAVVQGFADKVLNELMKAWETPEMQTFIGAIKKGLDEAIGFIKVAIVEAKALFEAITPVVMDVIKGLIGVFKENAPQLGTDLLSGFKKAIEFLKASIPKIKDFFGPAFESVKKTIMEVVDIIRENVPQVLQRASDVFGQFKDTVNKVDFETIIRELKDGLLPVIEGAGKVIIFVFKLIFGIIKAGLARAKGFMKGFKESFVVLGPTLQLLKDAIVELFNVIGKLFGDSPKEAENFYQIMEKIGQVSGFVFGITLSFLLTAIRLVVQLISLILDGWAQIFQYDWGVMWDEWMAQWALAGATVEKYVGIILGWLSQMWQNLINFPGMVMSMLQAFWDALVSYVTLAIASVRAEIFNFLLLINDKLAFFWLSVVDAVVGFFTSIWDAVVSWITKIVDWVVAGVKQMVDYLLGLPKKMYDVGANIFKNLWEGMKSVWGNISEWFGGVKDKILEFLNWKKKNSPSMKETWESSMKGLTNITAQGSKGFANQLQGFHNASLGAVGGGGTNNVKTLNDNRNLNMTVTTNVDKEEMKRNVQNEFTEMAFNGGI